MDNTYRFQLITLDESAKQAIQMEELIHFQETSHTEIEQLEHVLVSGYHHILIASVLNEQDLSFLESLFVEMKEPILVIPSSVEKNIYRSLLAIGYRVVLSPAETLTVVALSQTLRQLEYFFYVAEGEDDVGISHENLYALLQKRSLIVMYESDSVSASFGIMDVLNRSDIQVEDVLGAYIVFEIDEEAQESVFSEAMAMAQTRLPEYTDIFYGVKVKKRHGVGVKLLFSYMYDFISEIQQEISESHSYLAKAASLIDAYEKGFLTENELKLMCKRNEIDIDDIMNLHHLIYRQPANTARLMRAIRDHKISKESKIDMITDAIIDESVPLNIIEEIVEGSALELDSILEMHTLKKEGKLPVYHVENIDKEHAEIIIAQSHQQKCLLTKEHIEKTMRDWFSIDRERVTPFERNGEEWLVDKALSSEMAEEMIGFFEKSLIENRVMKE